MRYLVCKDIQCVRYLVCGISCVWTRGEGGEGEEEAGGGGCGLITRTPYLGYSESHNV